MLVHGSWWLVYLQSFLSSDLAKLFHAESDASDVKGAEKATKGSNPAFLFPALCLLHIVYCLLNFIGSSVHPF
jgi:hypothetical protein